MFGKDKKSESTCTCIASADISNAVSDNDTLRDYITRLTNSIDRTKPIIKYVADPTYVSKCGSATSASAIAKTYVEGATTIPEHIRMLEEMHGMLIDVHAAVCNRLNYAESVAELTDALDSMECPTNECKSCKYFRPGGVDFCNTNLRIAEFLVLNGIVNVFHVPGLDKTK